MGEQKQRQTRKERMLAAEPLCIYCGEAAVDIDHCPPTGMFDYSIRLKGLEFPACAECHDATRPLDAIAGMMSRVYPNIDPEEDSALAADHRKHIRGFINNFPDMAAIFTRDGDRQVPYRGEMAYALDLRQQPRLREAVLGFATRVGFALFREMSGAPVPPGATVYSRWYSNYDMDSDQLLDTLLREMGSPRTLVMGKRNAADVFRYWGSSYENDPNLFATFAAFRESFGTLSMTRLNDVAPDPAVRLFRQGFLKTFTF